MRASILALLVLAAGSTGALAYCPSVPDSAATGYSANQTALALCRQQELAERLRLQQQQVEVQAQINHLQMQQRRNEQFSRAWQALPQQP